LGRILAFDYGRKRTGIAVSDPLGMIANGLETVPSMEIWNFLKDYLGREKVETFVIGYPLQMDHKPSESMDLIKAFVRKLGKTYPEKKIEFVDERFSSKMAKQALIDGGAKKKDRQNKSLVDKLSAVIILQTYLDRLAQEKK
jgi:putative Holliday junction resolvase